MPVAKGVAEDLRLAFRFVGRTLRNLPPVSVYEISTRFDKRRRLNQSLKVAERTGLASNLLHLRDILMHGFHSKSQRESPMI